MKELDDSFDFDDEDTGDGVTEEELLEEDVTAKEGTKFVILSMEVTNTTKSEIEFPDSLVLTDKEERQFNTYSDSYMAIGDSLEYQDLAPSIKESGRLVYEVPEDSSDYYMIIRKAETDDAYKIILNK